MYTTWVVVWWLLGRGLLGMFMGAVAGLVVAPVLSTAALAVVVVPWRLLRARLRVTRGTRSAADTPVPAHADADEGSTDSPPDVAPPLPDAPAWSPPARTDPLPAGPDVIAIPAVALPACADEPRTAPAAAPPLPRFDEQPTAPARPRVTLRGVACLYVLLYVPATVAICWIGTGDFSFAMLALGLGTLWLALLWSLNR